MIFNSIIFGILVLSVFGVGLVSAQEMHLFLPMEEHLTSNWQLSEIKAQSDLAIEGTEQQADVVIRQYALQNQNNEPGMLVTLNVFEFSSPSVASQVHQANSNDILQDDVTVLNVTMPGVTDCFGAVANLNMTNELAIVSCSSDEFVVVSQSQQNGVVYENDERVYTSSVSASFTNFVIQNILDTENEKQIPDWVKNNAKWWSDGTISDNEFIQALEFLIEENIITVSNEQPVDIPNTNIPLWIKTNAGWWANGEISDQEFVKSIEYLINNGIIIV